MHSNIDLSLVKSFIITLRRKIKNCSCQIFDGHLFMLRSPICVVLFSKCFVLRNVMFFFPASCRLFGIEFDMYSSLEFLYFIKFDSFNITT